MSCSNSHRSIRVGPRVAVWLLTLTTISMCTTSAKAVINDTDWSLKISERELAFRPRHGRDGDENADVGSPRQPADRPQFANHLPDQRVGDRLHLAIQDDDRR